MALESANVGQTQPTVGDEEAAQKQELQTVLESLNEMGERVVQSLGRMHWLMQDIIGEMQSARSGAGGKAK